MKIRKIMHPKLRLLVALTVGFVMIFASAVTAQPMTDYQGQNHQEGHKDGHEGHEGHQSHYKGVMEVPASDTSAI